MTLRTLVVVLVSAGLCVAGCSSPSGSTQPADGTSTTPRSSGTASKPPEPPSTDPLPRLDPVAAWTPGAGEVNPEVKTAATAFLEAAGTWDGGAGAPERAVARLAARGHTPQVAATASALFDETAVAATLEVVYPQYGGLTDIRSSAMTVVRQRLLDPTGEVRERELVLDVRLVRPKGAAWKVAGVVPTPPLAGDGALSPAARAVLANDNVHLPASAEADLRRGALDDTMLGVLDGLGRQHEIDVLVFYDGHPTNVFETDRVSNHHVGRAVDIWRVDGHLVVDPQTPRALLEALMTRAGALGATEVGGPFDLNGDEPGYFTDPVHRDHIHVGVSENRPPAVP